MSPRGSESLTEVWVAETWEAHGEGHGVHGVYESREAAFEALKELPGMTVWVDAGGEVQGKPKRERKPGDFLVGYSGGLASQLRQIREWVPEQWAMAKPMPVHKRKEQEVDTP